MVCLFIQVLRKKSYKIIGIEFCVEEVCSQISQKSTESVPLIPTYPTMFIMTVDAIARHTTWLLRPGNYEWSKNSQFCLGKYTYLDKYFLMKFTLFSIKAYVRNHSMDMDIQKVFT